MKKELKNIVLYVLNMLIPASGLICLICAGNWQTRGIGIIITIISYLIYRKAKEVE